jgi:hypothetical protein
MRAAAALAVVLAAAAASGCAGPPRPGDDPRTTTPTVRSGVDPDAASAPQPEAAPAHADAALAVARSFALAARTWSPTTLRRNWRRQIALSTGALRATLRTTAPLAGDVARLRADHASASATIVTLAPIRADAGTTQVLVRLTERITAAGQTTTQTTANQVELIRAGRGWRVSAFTLAGSATAVTS